ncbi:hypothetical protein MHBO_000685 [Bonamia ostreae]|uniref:RNB domain-containing protein n=1 Tax=Bonamia ostreae TaxID=126728 RepID=A0ABV2AGH6_9EUKA
MCITGHVGSLFLTKQNVPAPYRVLPINDFKERLQNIRISRISLLRSLECAKINSKPHLKSEKAHSPMALSEYVQVTSPIRRIMDLLAHYQIRSAILEQRPPISKEFMTFLGNAAVESFQMSKRLQTSRNNFIILKNIQKKLEKEGPFRTKCDVIKVNSTNFEFEKINFFQKDYRKNFKEGTATVIIKEAYPSKGALNFEVISTKPYEGKDLDCNEVVSRYRLVLYSKQVFGIENVKSDYFNLKTDLEDMTK